MVVIMELTDKWVAIHLATLYRCVKFYKTFQRLSTQCVDNLVLYFRGHIIELYYRLKILKLVIGMKKEWYGALMSVAVEESLQDFKHGFYLGFEIASAVLNQGSK